MRFLLSISILLLSLTAFGCGDSVNPDGVKADQANTDLTLKERPDDYYQVKMLNYPDHEVYMYEFIDGFGHVNEQGAATIDGQAFYTRFILEKTGDAQYSIKIGSESDLIRGEFKLTITGDHSATMELITRDCGFF